MASEVALVVDGRKFVRLGPEPEIPPDARGTYALVLRLDEPARLAIGRLGVQSFPPGQYVYCGSALGGLRARVARHLRVEKRRRWHVDYLLAVARVADVWVCEAPERLECRLAAHLAGLPGASHPAPGFGSSDCRCPSHLLLVPADGWQAPGVGEAEGREMDDERHVTDAFASGEYA